MTNEQATAIIAAVCQQHAAFRPTALPTPTVGGWRVTFEQVSVQPASVASWFSKCGATITLCGVENCYAVNPTWVAEFR